MTFSFDHLYYLKLKNLKTKKIGWLDYSKKKIELVYKKYASGLKGDNTFEAIKKVIEANKDYKILEIKKLNVLSPNE